MWIVCDIADGSAALAWMSDGMSVSLADVQIGRYRGDRGCLTSFFDPRGARKAWLSKLAGVVNAGGMSRHRHLAARGESAGPELSRHHPTLTNIEKHMEATLILASLTIPLDAHIT